jgi:hypothetical protein
LIFDYILINLQTIGGEIMAFERFTKSGRGYSPKVSIWKRGQIGFNQGAVERFNLKNFDYAVLFYDKNEKRIGVKFVNDQSEEGANKIIKGKTGIFFSAKAFLDYYDISHSETTKCDVNYDEENDLYVFDHE